MRQTHVSNCCKFQLSSDIEKNPGPTPVYIDPSKTITAPTSLCPLIYNNKTGIHSANHLVSIKNVQGNQLYSSLSQLTGQSLLMQTELPTLLMCSRLTMNFNTVKATLPADKNKHK